jgi:CHAD domain-containing protein
MPLASLPVALLEPRLSALVAHLPDALGGGVRSIHQARVASRRLREVLPVVGIAAGHRRLQRAVRRVRRVTRALGPVRELDVTLQLLGDLADSPSVPAQAVRFARRAVGTERYRRRATMLEGLDARAVERTREAVEAVLTKVRNTPDDGAWLATLAARALTRAEALADTIGDVGLLFDPARLHVVRIAAKKLRYTLELTAEARLAATARLVTTLKESQEQLGRLHDLQVLLVFVRSAEIEGGPRLRQPLATLRDVIEQECHREHARYLRRRGRLIAVCDAVAESLRRESRATNSNGDRPRAGDARQHPAHAAPGTGHLAPGTSHGTGHPSAHPAPAPGTRHLPRPE